jgi:drug/metabolite transporter (DMT)-like permease
VLLWGATAILGKAIAMPAFPLVLWRMAIVVAALGPLRSFWRELAALTPRRAAVFAGIGALVAAHWVTFYGAIKLANASVAATCMALTPAFVAFVEPALTGSRFNPREVFFGVALIPGVALVVGGVPSGMRAGIAVGVLSAAIVSVFGTLNKRFIRDVGTLAVTGVEMAAGAAALAAVAPIWPGARQAFVFPDRRDALLLLVLAVVCTLVPFALSLVALRRLSAYDTALAVNMEPVYAITLAVVFFGEQHELRLGFYAGVAIIVGVVFSHSLLGAWPKALAAAPGEGTGAGQ